jgi:adenosylcobinamide-GDP ribazoletransferase
LAIYLRIPALLLMCVLSRWSAVLGVFLFPYARIQGKARVFIDGMNLRTFMLSSIAAFIFAFFILGFKGLFILLVIAAFVYLSGRKIKGRIGGITGDVLGATIELSEVITLITVFIIARS